MSDPTFEDFSEDFSCGGYSVLFLGIQLLIDCLDWIGWEWIGFGFGFGEGMRRENRI